jgi:hypothetical protein
MRQYRESNLQAKKKNTEWLLSLSLLDVPSPPITLTSKETEVKKDRILLAICNQRIIRRLFLLLVICIHWLNIRLLIRRAICNE